MSIVSDPSTKISPLAVFRNRNFSKIWTGQLISTMGTALTSLAASIYIFRLTNSAMSVGLMLMATAAPSLLVGLFAGVLVDRIDRKKIMISADLFRAVLVLLVPILIPLNVIWLYVIVMLTSAIGQFFDPAHESLLPEVASDEELAAANSLMAISSFGSTAIGFAASGLIASAANINWAFYLDAVTFLISAIFISTLQIKPFIVEGKTNMQLVFSNLKIGVRQLFDTPILRSLFISSIPTLVAFGLSNALLLPFALRALNATEFEYGIQEGLTSLGFVAGSLLIAGIFDRMREGVWIAAGFIVMALTSMVYSFISSITLAIIVITVSGFFNAPASIGRRLVVQRNTPREMRGRVNSVFFVTRDVLFLIGMAIAGLADYIDVRWMFFSSGVLLLGGGFLVVILPGLRQNRYQWSQALNLLRTASTEKNLAIGRPASPTDMDMLIGLLPTLSSLSINERENLLSQAQVVDIPAETTILQHGDISDVAYFILSGKVVAGVADYKGKYRSLSTMIPGDFFGEIAALTGAVRTADVVSAEKSTLIKVPAKTLRSIMVNQSISDLILSKMSERLNRTTIKELPRFAGVDQQDVRDLHRTNVEE